MLILFPNTFHSYLGQEALVEVKACLISLLGSTGKEEAQCTGVNGFYSLSFKDLHPISWPSQECRT